MSRKLDDLSDRFRPLAIELLARCVEQRIAVVIVDTLRTDEEQAKYLARGVSWTTKSKHLPQEPDGKAEAIDVAPAIVAPGLEGGGAPGPVGTEVAAPPLLRPVLQAVSLRSSHSHCSFSTGPHGRYTYHGSPRVSNTNPPCLSVLHLRDRPAATATI